MVSKAKARYEKVRLGDKEFLVKIDEEVVEIPKAMWWYFGDWFTRVPALLETLLKIEAEQLKVLRVIAGIPIVPPPPPLEVTIPEGLKRANDYDVHTLDLGTARTLEEIPMKGFALTIFKCTGTMELRLNKRTARPIPVEALSYPEMIIIDWMDFDTLFVTNTAQSGKEAVLIAWRRE